jgi:hypothetical protein
MARFDIYPSPDGAGYLLDVQADLLDALNIVSAKMNDIDPQAWLADVLARLPDLPVSRVHELLPWHWKAVTEMKRIAA